jgi:hypothetical protein
VDVQNVSLLGALFSNIPTTVFARSKACTVSDHSKSGITGSNPTPGMDMCVRLFCVCIILCVGSGFATS